MEMLLCWARTEPEVIWTLKITNRKFNPKKKNNYLIVGPAVLPLLVSILPNLR